MAIGLGKRARIGLRIAPCFVVSGRRLSIAKSTVGTSFVVGEVIPSTGVDQIVLLLDGARFTSSIGGLCHRSFSSIIPNDIGLSTSVDNGARVMGTGTLCTHINILTGKTSRTVCSPIIQLG